jgi:hypothetical protein
MATEKLGEKRLGGGEEGGGVRIGGGARGGEREADAGGES